MTIKLIQLKIMHNTDLKMNGFYFLFNSIPHFLFFLLSISFVWFFCLIPFSICCLILNIPYLLCRWCSFCNQPFGVESVQDFLIKLDIKPQMHLLEISIFSQNNDLVRLTKIMNNLVKDLKILSFKVIFKLVESFQKKFLWRIFD